MKKTISIIIILAAIVAGFYLYANNQTAEFKVYETDTYSFEYPTDWNNIEEGKLVANNDSKLPALDIHIHPFGAPGWERISKEEYRGRSGIKWGMSYNKIAQNPEFEDWAFEDWSSEFSESHRFITVTGEDLHEQIGEFILVYNYDEEQTPDAAERLKALLDSFKIK